MEFLCKIHLVFRNNRLETWQNGCHNGVLLQRSYRQLAGSGKVEEDDSEDRFLLVTVTRARSSNLRARLSLIPDSSVKTISFDSNVTEILIRYRIVLCLLYSRLLPAAVASSQKS